MATDTIDDMVCGAGPGMEHVVQFYRDEAELMAGIGPYLGGAVREGAVAVAIVTPDHRRALELHLEDDGIDVAGALGRGDLVLLDAAEILARFATDGGIDPDAFRRVAGALLSGATREGRRARVYGEIVALLWSAGDVLDALRLESLWNELAPELDFSLYCAYPSHVLEGPPAGVQRVRDLHSSVLASSPRSVRPAELADERTFEAVQAGPRAARHWVGEVLSHWQFAGDDLVADASLVVTELSENAIVHADAAFTVGVRTAGRVVRLSVRDGGGGSPKLMARAPTRQSGRGLQIVAHLANRWGVDMDRHGKTVWAEIGKLPRRANQRR